MLTALRLGVELTPKSSTRACARGADGEVAVAKVLDGLVDEGWVAVHDRRLPRGPQLDHVVVGPGGVFTVDAKRYTGQLRVDGRGAIRIAGRDKTALLVQAQRQAACITAHLRTRRPSAPAATPVLCFVGTDLPRQRQVVSGVHVVTRRGLKRLLTGSAPIIGSHDVLDIGAYLDAALSPAASSAPKP